ncbi:hypothetical protein MKW98_028159 [Papaver atlanticum]|uniref:MATH domain-containing protein n=1 Tax=Papaver atlanticum TaxID=357466 RepID=A0AAD4SXE0_9MAGN|nr:hypothetical protein MKW98_028159 [Papaver atlanticum]
MAKTPELTPDARPTGAITMYRDAPPTHFSFTIRSFSMLTKTSIESYETNHFEAGGYKWKLCLYPNGNKTKNIKDHISLYLVMVDTNSLNPVWNVQVVFKLFLYDQHKDKYLAMEDSNTRRFHVRKMDWGFDQFIAHKAFNDPANGYLVDDVAVFGAEVFVSKESCKGREEHLSMIKGAVAFKHSWKIENFSKAQTEFLESEAFTAGDHSWKVRLFPKGSGEDKGTHLSLYLVLAEDPAKLPVTRKVYVEFILRVKHISDGRFVQNKVIRWFGPGNSKGWAKFLQLTYMTQQGFLQRDSCNVEAEVTVLGVVD